MRNAPPASRCWFACPLIAFLSACLQGDQTLPFDVDGGGSAQVTIGADGGIVSLLPVIAIHFPAGSFSGPVTIQERVEPFPDEVGVAVVGTAFDIEPSGAVLAAPARVELNVPIERLQAGDVARLAVGVARHDGSVVAFQGAYDVTNGILTAEIDELGPVAAIVLTATIPVALGSPGVLGGARVPPPAWAPAHGGASHRGWPYGWRVKSWPTTLARWRSVGSSLT